MPAKEETSGAGVFALVGPAQQPGTIEDLRQFVARQPTDALKAELARLLGFTAENLVRLAVVVHELESRGEDLAHLRMGLLPLLRQIACGKLLPEAVVAFAGQPALIKRVAQMPLEEQKQVVAQGYLPPPKPKPRPDYKNQHTPWKKPDGEDERSLPAVRSIALRGSEKDVAEMVVELLTGGDSTLGVFRETLLLLRAKDLCKGRDLTSPAARKAKAEERVLKQAVAAALMELEVLGA